MKKERILIICALIFSLFLSTNVLALVPDCGNNTIMTLYSEYNSHAAVFNGTAAPGASIAICYNKFFSGNDYTNNPNPWTCGANKVITLSSLTNAHTSNGTYSTNICFGDLKCTVESGSCTGTEKAIASISSLTNAHISNGTSYPYKICCSRITVPTLSAQWSDNDTGIIINSAEKDDIVNLTVGTSNIASGSIDLIVYNRSNGFVLARFDDIPITNNKAEISKNLGSEILMGNASAGDVIYFNASYGSLVVSSNDLNINDTQRRLNIAKWQFNDYIEVKTINQTDEMRIYVETTGFQTGENITFRIYNSENTLVNETSYPVNNNIANSPFMRIRLLIPSSFLGNGEVFYFNASDSLGKTSILSKNITYEPDITSSGFVSHCYIEVLTRDECNNAEMFVDEDFYSCGVLIKQSKCYFDDVANKCLKKDFPDINNEINDPAVCEASSDGEFSRCVDGWKTLNVKVTPLELCRSGECNPGDIYRVPCREVALLPVFTLTNIILAAGLIIIVYLVIFKSSLFNSNKTSGKKKKNK